MPRRHGDPGHAGPGAPANLTANAPTSNRVDLSRGAAVDNVGVTGYEVYRGGALLGTTAATSYSDASVSPGTTYSSSASPRRNRQSLGPQHRHGDDSARYEHHLRSFPALADARVFESAPTTNYASSYLRVDVGSDPDVESYLSFDVGGVSTAVLSAKLRLFAYSGTANGPAAYGTGSGWSETDITWAGRPRGRPRDGRQGLDPE